MPPSLALFICTVFVLWIIRRDPARSPDVSGALWIPLIWLLILAARLPSQWLGVTAATATEAYNEGNALDRTIYIALILLGIRVLKKRGLRLSALFGQNVALFALLFLGLLSIAWSDFPFIAMKRWVRDLGGLLMVIVVLSESNPLESVATLLRRIAYVHIPFSVILVKYYPAIGRGYDSWSGVASYFGTTLNKNTLGVLCLLSGLYFLWDSLRRLSDWRDRPTRRILLLNVFFISMTLWLLNLANSSTSTVCLILGSTIICVGYLRSFQRNPTVVAVAVPVLLISYVLLDSFFEIRAAVTGMVGRDPTFTTRTDLWHYLDSMKTNWLLGAGYESFWLGPRLQQIWAVFSYLPNQAHNGYREIYLNLGMVGLSMLVIFLLASYRLIFRAIRTTPGAALLSLALWSGIILYNVTEAAFKNNHALWLCFLVCNLNLRFLDRQARAEVFKPKPSKLRFAVAPSLNQPPSPLTQNGRRSLGLLRPPLRRV